MLHPLEGSRRGGAFPLKNILGKLAWHYHWDDRRNKKLRIPRFSFNLFWNRWKILNELSASRTWNLFLARFCKALILARFLDETKRLTFRVVNLLRDQIWTNELFVWRPFWYRQVYSDGGPRCESGLLDGEGRTSSATQRSILYRGFYRKIYRF